MKDVVKRVLLAVALALAWAAPASPHQIDEYLQATRLGISCDRVDIEVDVTPGVSIAPAVIAAIDRNADGRIAPQEIEAFARGLVSKLSLHVDDRPYSLALVRAEAPSTDELRDGTARIRVQAVADVPLRTSGGHRIRYENADRSANGVYMVNALKPEDRQLTIVGQQRDRLQHSIALDVVVTPRSDAVAWLGLSTLGLVVLVGVRRGSYLHGMSRSIHVMRVRSL